MDEEDYSFDRAIDLELPGRQSVFLWGPRKTGKSTLLRNRYPDAPFYDLLDSDVRLDLERRPANLRDWIAAAKPGPKTPIILDEMQKVPAVLDEVHFLIERKKYAFVMCGSSARKLSGNRGNLLGGRAWRFEMFPLVSAEVPDLDLARALRNGLLPAHYRAARPDRALSAYVRDYLEHEIAAEALTRRLSSFARFLDLAGLANGQLVNLVKMASEVAVDAKTIRNYFGILQDTMIGRFLEGLSPRPGSRRNLVATPKFYLFDPGVARFLRGSNFRDERHAEGHLFETFIFNELMAYQCYRDQEPRLNFYRTHTDLEVDFVLNQGETAIEATLSNHIRMTDLRGLFSFLEEYPKAKALVVCLEARPRLVEKDGRTVEILPWRDFCARLWKGEWKRKKPPK